MLGTFWRDTAVEQEEIDFFATGHPIVEALFGFLRDGPYGRNGCRAIEHRGAAARGLEVLFHVVPPEPEDTSPGARVPSRQLSRVLDENYPGRHPEEAPVEHAGELARGLRDYKMSSGSGGTTWSRTCSRRRGAAVLDGAEAAPFRRAPSRRNPNSASTIGWPVAKKSISFLLDGGVAPERAEHGRALAELQAGSASTLSACPKWNAHWNASTCSSVSTPMPTLRASSVTISSRRSSRSRRCPTGRPRASRPGRLRGQSANRRRRRGPGPLAVEVGRPAAVVGPADRAPAFGHAAARRRPGTRPLCGHGRAQLEDGRLDLLSTASSPPTVSPKTPTASASRVSTSEASVPASRRRGCRPAGSDRCGRAGRCAAPWWPGSTAGRS